MTYLLGVDAGETKTIAIVANEDGQILGCGRAACGSIYRGWSPKGALGELDKAVLTALSAAKVNRHQLAAGGFNMAGAVWPEDVDLLRSHLVRRHFGKEIAVVFDAFGALRARSPDGTGVAVVCGTGDATCARSPSGRTWHSSYWQRTGGAHELALAAIEAVYRSELGLTPPTDLTQPVLDYYEQPNVEALLHAFTRRASMFERFVNRLNLMRRFTQRVAGKPKRVDGLCPIVFDVACSGDEVAAGIIRNHGAALGDYALVAARKTGMDMCGFNLVLAGGVLHHPSHLLADAVVSRVRQEFPRIEVIDAGFEPVVGALMLAMDLAEIPSSDPVLANLKRTAPQSALFSP
jgi:N-acetylglucosamine kinase-like BadF-type ATPase